MDLNEKVKISFQEDTLHIELEDRESFIDKEGHLMIEYIEEALGDYQDGIVECNEINSDAGGLWINGATGKVYIWSGYITSELKEKGKTSIKPSGEMIDYVDLNIADDLKFLEWYFSTDDEHQAIQAMYELCGWVVTDIDTAQAYKEIEKDRIYKFREMRGDDEVGYSLTEETLDINDYSIAKIAEACIEFDIPKSDVREWLGKNENIPLMLECIFELES